MSKLLLSLFSDTSGATAVEYGLMVGLVAVVIAVAVAALGVDVRDLFEDPRLNAALSGS